MDRAIYPIHHILKIYTEQIRTNQINALKQNISSNTYYDEIMLSANGKKKQLIDQLISEAIMQLTSHIREQNGGKKAEDVPHDLLLENEGRR